MSDAEWDAHWVRSIGVRLDGSAINELAENGEPVVDDDLLMLLNAHDGDVTFKLPTTLHGGTWDLVIDTSDSDPTSHQSFATDAEYRVRGRSLALLRSPREE